MVSVPSFGDSFFISLFLVGQVFPDHVGFPSPHSGILFLCVQKKILRRFSALFPSPHSGILFLSEWVDSEWLTEKVEFPSPHSGILFL